MVFKRRFFLKNPRENKMAQVKTYIIMPITFWCKIVVKRIANGKWNYAKTKKEILAVLSKNPNKALDSLLAANELIPGW